MTRVTVPILITADKIVSSSAADVHAPAEWLIGTTYGLGAIRQVAADFKIYESLVAGNLGNVPKSSPRHWRIIGPTETAYDAGATYAMGATVSAGGRVCESLVAGNIGNPLPVSPALQTDKWIDVGPTNKMAMFDLDSNSQTVCASPMTVVVAVGERMNTIGLAGMAGNTLVISATSVFGGGTIYGPSTVDLNTRIVLDAYDYFFGPFGTRASHVVHDVPPLSDIIVTVTLSSTSGNVKVGGLVLGTYIWLGDVVRGAKNSGKNYTTIRRDDWGNARVRRQRTIPAIRQTVLVPVWNANRVLAAREALNGVVALYTGLDDPTSPWFDTLQVLGVAQVFDLDVTNVRQGALDLGLEGL